MFNALKRRIQQWLEIDDLKVQVEQCQSECIEEAVFEKSERAIDIILDDAIDCRIEKIDFKQLAEDEIDLENMVAENIDWEDLVSNAVDWDDLVSREVDFKAMGRQQLTEVLQTVQEAIGSMFDEMKRRSQQRVGSK